MNKKYIIKVNGIEYHSYQELCNDLEIDFKEIITYNWTAIIVGTIVSGIVGYLCIKYFMKFLSRFSLAIFGYYCLIMGIFSFVFFLGR